MIDIRLLLVDLAGLPEGSDFGSRCRGFSPRWSASEHSPPSRVSRTVALRSIAEGASAAAFAAPGHHIAANPKD